MLQKDDKRKFKTISLGEFHSIPGYIGLFWILVTKKLSKIYEVKSMNQHKKCLGTNGIELNSINSINMTPMGAE